MNPPPAPVKPPARVWCPRGVLGIAALAASTPVQSQELPPTVADLLREATKEEREVIENVAKRLYPASRTEINDTVERIEDDEKASVGEQSFAEGWSGEGSVGATWSSGNTDEWSVSTSIDIERKGPRWQHSFDLDTMLKDTDGVRTEERVRGSYRARLDIARSRWFTFLQLFYTRDLEQEIDRRFAEGLGLGYQIVDRDKLTWEVSAGPALRQTRYDGGASEKRLGAFFASEVKWDVTDTLVFREEGTAFFDASGNNLNSTTSITSNLYGRLSGRLSFEATVETDPPSGTREVDTHTSFSLVFAL